MKREEPSTESPAMLAAGTVVFGTGSATSGSCLSPLDRGFIHRGCQTRATSAGGALSVLRVGLFGNAAQIRW